MPDSYFIRTITIAAGVFLLIASGGPRSIRAESPESDPGRFRIQSASMADDADLTRSVDGETFEQDSHESEHDSSELGDHESDSHSDFQGHEEDSHENVTDHEGSQGEQGQAPEPGGGGNDRGQ